MTFLEGGAKLAVVTGGWHDQGVALIDVATERLVASAGLGYAWAGLAAAGNDLYISGGPKAIRLIHATGETLDRDADLEITPKGGWTSGVRRLRGRGLSVPIPTPVFSLDTRASRSVKLPSQDIPTA